MTKKKEKPKEEPKTTDISTIVETPKEPDKPKEEPKEPEKVTPTKEPIREKTQKQQKTKKTLVKLPPRGKDKAKRKPREQTIDTGKLDVTTKDEKKKGYSAGVKAGIVLASLGIFAIAFYAMYKALEKYRAEKKQVEFEEEEFVEGTEEAEEFVGETSIEQDAQAEHDATKDEDTN